MKTKRRRKRTVLRNRYDEWKNLSVIGAFLPHWDARRMHVAVQLYSLFFAFCRHSIQADCHQNKFRAKVAKIIHSPIPDKHLLLPTGISSPEYGMIFIDPTKSCTSFYPHTLIAMLCHSYTTVYLWW